MNRRNWMLLLALTAMVAACSSHHHNAARATTVPSTAPTTTVPDPDVVPAVITPAYVNAVFAVLNHINGNASRSLVSSGELTGQVRSDLRAIYNDPLYTQEITIAQQSLSQSLDNVRRPPGDIVTSVERLISATPTCVFVETESDYSAVLVEPGHPSASEFFKLSPKSQIMDPENLNPTPWSISFNAAFLTPTSVPNQC
jgi:hypothetical protein